MNEERSAPRLIFADLGRRSYGPVLELQQQLAERLRAEPARAPEWLLAVEHEPVITVGRRGSRADVLLDEERRRALGVELYQVERGGELTYHGPGQLVVYAIVRVDSGRFGIADLVRGMAAILVEQLSEIGISAAYRPEAPGIWVSNAKIGAVGMRVQGGVSSHGVALNVSMDLEAFSWFVPCGMADVIVTDLSQELGPGVVCPRLGDLARSFAHRFAERFLFELSCDASGLLA